ncbi:hypothetical protein [Aeromonas hydrophila]
MPIGQVLKQVFLKLKDSNLHPAIKIGGMILIACGVGYATLMGIPL